MRIVLRRYYGGYFVGVALWPGNYAWLFRIGLITHYLDVHIRKKRAQTKT